MMQIKETCYIFLVLLFGIKDVLSISTAQNEVCRNHYMKKIQNPSDETQYIVCTDEPIVGKCIQSTSNKICFDEVQQKCSKDACGKETETTKYMKSVKANCETSTYFFQTYPALDCEHYYICTREGQDVEVMQMSCPKNQHYSREKKTCLPLFEAGCESFVALCSKQEEGYKFAVDNSSCTEYYECKQGKPKLMPCPYNEQFDETRGTCVEPSKFVENKCFNKLFMPDCINENNGQYLRHPRCNKYYICVNGVALETQCQSGYYFNETNKICTKTDKHHSCEEWEVK